MGVGRRPFPAGAECPESPGSQSHSLARTGPASPPSLGLPLRMAALCLEEGSFSLGYKWEKGPQDGACGWRRESRGLGCGFKKMFSSKKC